MGWAGRHEARRGSTSRIDQKILTSCGPLSMAPSFIEAGSLLRRVRKTDAGSHGHTETRASATLPAGLQASKRRPCFAVRLTIALCSPHFRASI